MQNDKFDKNVHMIGVCIFLLPFLSVWILVIILTTHLRKCSCLLTLLTLDVFISLALFILALAWECSSHFPAYTPVWRAKILLHSRISWSVPQRFFFQIYRSYSFYEITSYKIIQYLVPAFMILCCCRTFVHFHSNLIFFPFTELQSLIVYLPENLSTCFVHNRIINCNLMWQIVFSKDYDNRMYLISHALFTWCQCSSQPEMVSVSPLLEPGWISTNFSTTRLR